MPADNAPSAQATIQAGRQHYAAKRYKPALEQFTRAMKLCSCYRGMKRERCSCKKYEDVASKDGSIFNEAMYSCTCSVGKTFNKCDKDDHIQALDYRAATFEALEELERARRDAEWMLELAPRRLDGYLRLGKVARLQKKPDFAWKIYTAGIETAHDNAEPGSAKLKQLYAARQPLQRRFGGKDPLQLPLEIVLMIFAHVDFVDLVRCLRVSKIWSRTLTSHGTVTLWRSLDFPDRRKGPTVTRLRTIVSHSSNNIRQLVLRNASHFGLNQSKLNVLMNGSKNLERLDIRNLDPDPGIAVPDSFVCKTLKHLTFEGYSPRELTPVDLASIPFPATMLSRVAESLRSLELINIPPRAYYSAPKMPLLKSLRVVHRELVTVHLPLFELAMNMPTLERLWLQDVRLFNEAAVNSEWAEWRRVLNKLDTLILAYTRRTDTFTQLVCRALLCANSSRGLRSLEILTDMDPETLFSTDYTTPVTLNEGNRLNGFTGLEVLRLNNVSLLPEKAKEIIMKPLRKETLHTLDIVFPMVGLGEPEGASSLAYLTEHEWLREAPSIRSMGIFGFSFPSYFRHEKDNPLPSFLGSLPNLQILEIRSARYSEREFCSMIKAILATTHLKTIYQDQVLGVCLEELRVLTEGHGVKLVFGGRPRDWPTTLDE